MNKMASSMVIPASKDTLFMRGFSSRLHTDEIKDFFTREAGRNTVEFFKDDGNGQLYIALRFESKDVAKETLNRFDNTDILGDRVSMSWYKDLRKLRTDNYRRPGGNRHWTPEDQYDYRDRGMYQRRMYNPRGRWPPQPTGRSRHYTRSSSRSRSRSFSQSPSARSYSRSRSSSASYDSRDKKKKRHSISDSGKRRKPSEKRKVAKTQQSPSIDRDTSASESSAPHGKRVVKKGEEEGSADRKAVRAKDRNVGEVEDDGGDGIADARSDNNDYSVEPSSPPAGAKAVRNIRSAVLSIDRTKTRPVPKQPESEDGIIPDIASPDVLESAKRQEPVVAVPVYAKETAKTKKLKDDRRLYEEQISDEEEAMKEKMPLATKKTRDDHVDEEFFAFEKPRGTRLVKSNLVGQTGGGGGAMSDPYEPEETRDVRGPKKRKPATEDILEYERSTELDYEEEMEVNRRDENDSRRRRIDPVSIQDMRQPRAPYDGGISASGKRRPFYNENASSVNRGALGLSQEKMALIRDKKEEIEKAYRQDCETFATVTKLLISKDPDLEERIQNSLRENLKEIGQRCIQELRDFVDRLKTEDDL